MANRSCWHSSHCAPRQRSRRYRFLRWLRLRLDLRDVLHCFLERQRGSVHVVSTRFILESCQLEEPDDAMHVSEEAGDTRVLLRGRSEKRQKKKAAPTDPSGGGINSLGMGKSSTLVTLMPHRSPIALHVDRQKQFPKPYSQWQSPQSVYRI